MDSWAESLHGRDQSFNYTPALFWQMRKITVNVTQAGIKAPAASRRVTSSLDKLSLSPKLAVNFGQSSVGTRAVRIGILLGFPEPSNFKWQGQSPTATRTISVYTCSSNPPGNEMGGRKPHSPGTHQCWAYLLNTLRTGLLNCLNARSRGLTFRHCASCI